MDGGELGGAKAGAVTLSEREAQFIRQPRQ
jgi:hypothetical protein